MSASAFELFLLEASLLPGLLRFFTRKGKRRRVQSVTSSLFYPHPRFSIYVTVYPYTDLPKKTRAKSASARVVLSGIRSHLGHAAVFLLRLLLAFVFRHDFNGRLFSRLCILLFSLGFRQDAVTERLDRSILRHYGKKRPRQHTRCVNNYSLASRRVVVSRDIARRLKPRELKTIIFFHYVPRCAVALHTRSPRRTRTSFVSHRTIKSRRDSTAPVDPDS